MKSYRPEKKVKTTHEIFEQVCLLAIQNNISGINALVAEGCCIDVRRGVDSPVMWLARQGEEGAVAFLIKHFNASVLEAVCGYVVDDLYILQGIYPLVPELSEEYVNAGFTFDILKVTELLGSLLLNRDYTNFTGHFNLSFKAPTQSIDDYVRQEVLYLRTNIHSARSIANSVEYVRAYALAFTAMTGQVEWLRLKMNEIEQPYGHEAIVRGYVGGGHVDLANAYMAKEKYALNKMAFWHAKERNFDNAGDLLRRGAGALEVISGCYESGLFRNAKDITRILATTKSHEFFTLITDHIKDGFCISPQVKVDRNKLIRLRKIIHEYQITYDAAEVLTISGVREWLLQRGQICSDRLASDNSMIVGLPFEIYFQITLLTLGLSRQATEQLFSAVHRVLFVNVVRSLTQKYAFGLFAEKDEFLAGMIVAEQRYIARLQ